MSAKIVLPKTMPESINPPGHVFFLAGPVRGGNDWQSECHKIFSRYSLSCTLVIPVSYPSDHPIRAHEITPNSNPEPVHHIKWERRWMEFASRKGCLMFWLPCESKTVPRDPAEGPYAQDTRGELGEWRGHLMFEHHRRVVIGMEEDFPGQREITHNFREAVRESPECWPRVRTLQQTVDAAIIRAQQ